MIEFPFPRQRIPIPPTPLIGREALLATARAMLADPQVRLLTLVGPGGVGKTRLALELALALDDELADGACLVSLEALQSAELVPVAIAKGLGISLPGGREPELVLREAVSGREWLLVLDNFEHLLAAAPVVVDLLSAGAGLKMLVTSREPLRVRGEHEIAVPPLSLPEEMDVASGALDLDALAATPAVALFVQRARAACFEFTLTNEDAGTIATICARLDGLPLAIELAAARISHLSPGAILARIDRQRSARFALLTGGPRDAPPRLRAMRDTIAWSYDLLDNGERAMFGRLAVFVGGFTLEAAAAVCEVDEWEALEGIRSLVEKSLVRGSNALGAEPRFGMLETIRAFALERLAASGEASGVQQRHAEWYFAYAIENGLNLRGPRDLDALHCLEREHANLRAALSWLSEQGDAVRTAHMATALCPFWEEHAHYREGRQWLEIAIGLGVEMAPAERLPLLLGAGTMAWYEGDFARATERHRQALSLARAIGDRAAEAAALNNLGVQAMEQGENARAAAQFAASLALARPSGETRAVIFALHNLAQVARLEHEGAVAAARLGEALTMARELGDEAIVSSGLTALGHVLLDLGEASRADAAFRESLALSDRRGNAGDAIDALEGFARLGAEQGEAERAARLFGAAAALREAVGTPSSPSDTAYFAPAMAALQRVLGADRLAAIVAEGRKLSRREAVATALSVAPYSGRGASITLLPGASAAAQDADAESGDLPDLTPREMEVLRLLAEGLSDKEIGARLTISPQTVAKHVGSLRRKLGAPSRTAAATLAVRRGRL
ncbi:MAG: hypothetical protein IT338_14685 [Thermomicrobiales bacterium]|nr:hypothetical protein [Thermomicrobiales bacterium]